MAAVEVEADPVAVDGKCQLDGQILIAHAVIVQNILETVGAIGQVPDGRPGFAFAVADPFLAEFQVRFQTDLFAELHDLVGTELVGDELSLNIAAPFFL